MEIESETYSGLFWKELHRLTTLNLSYNQLTRINPNSFNQLNWLYLDYNPIQTIEDDAFENAKNLERLITEPL